MNPVWESSEGVPVTVPLSSPPGSPSEHPAQMGLAKAGLAAASFTNVFLSMVRTFQCDYDERYCISEYAMRLFNTASKAPDGAFG